MTIDLLHDRIRKMKNPSMIDFRIKLDSIPEHLLEEESSEAMAYGRFCRELLEGLKDTVPSVRFPFGAFALLGPDGVAQLQILLRLARELGYYILLDSPEILSPWAADRVAETVLNGESFLCDALLISSFIGSDGVKPFLAGCKVGQKDLFVVVRSPNKTASEIQDLLTGSRHVYSASAEMVSRFGEQYLGRCGYSCICGAASAGSPEILRTLRTKHSRMFLLVDGIDYPGGNAKNCSYAFDRFGYGAVVCAGPSVTAAWKSAEMNGADYVQLAIQSADRMKRNLCRYVSIL